MLHSPTAVGMLGKLKGGAITRSVIRSIRLKLSRAWIRTVMWICIALLVPEYAAPLFAILALVASVRASFEEKRPYYCGGIAVPIAIMILLIALGMFYSENALSTLGTVGLVVLGAITFLSVTSVITTRRRLEMVIFSLTLAVTVNGVISGIQFLIGPVMGFDIDLAFWRTFDDSFLGLFGGKLSYYIGERSSSTFCNPNVFAESMAMLLPFGLYYACSHRRDTKHNLCRFLVPIAFFGTLFSFSRGVYMALIIVLLVYSLYHIKKLRFILTFAVIIILLIPSSVYTRFFSISGVQEFISQVITDFNNTSHADYEGSLLDAMMNFFQKALSSGTVENSSGLRFSAWITTLGLILKKPFFGYGAGYANVKSLLASAEVSTVLHTHNFILQTLVEGGIVLLATVAVIEIMTLVRSVRLICRSSNPKLGLAIGCFLIAFIVIGLTDIPTLTPKSIMSCFIGLAISESAHSLYYLRHPVEIKDSFLAVGRIFQRKKSSSKEKTH